MKRFLFVVLVALLFYGCQKREPVGPTSASGPTTYSAPEEPVLNLAWRSAQLFQTGMINSGLPASVRILPVSNAAGIPPEAVNYFQAVLETRLQTFGIQMPGDAPLRMKGSLYYLRDQLVFAFQVVNTNEAVVFSDSAAIPRDERLQKTLARFRSASPEQPSHQHGQHKEGPIPTPVAQLDQPPLDIAQFCDKKDAPCELAILYPDRIEILNWTTLARRIKSFPAQAFAMIPSRAPSGKIIKIGDDYLILSSNFTAPLLYDSEFNGPISGGALPVLPAAAQGMNYFTLGDGRFFDFEPLQPGGMAVIETNRKLSIAREGTLRTTTEPAGASLAVHWPVVYTSAPVLPGEPDSVQKYTYSDQALLLDSSRPAQGEIVDLALTDLNRDDSVELLVTIRRPEGVFVEVWEAF